MQSRNSAHRPLNEGPPSHALLLAAHGERMKGADNRALVRLAAMLRERNLAHEVAIGFIKGTPSIGQSVQALAADNLIIYPVFMSDGYFTRVRLPQLLREALRPQSKRRFQVLPPLGLEPALSDLIARGLLAIARERALPPEETNMILLAHGSTTDPASRVAAEQIVQKMRGQAVFRSIGLALLEEAPHLSDVASAMTGALIVFGLFAGEGLHGAQDGPRLVEQLGRADAIFAGTVTNLDGLEELIAAAIAKSIHPAQFHQERAR
jgi:sirohydrochlorin cobaltochelatase